MNGHFGVLRLLLLLFLLRVVLIHAYVLIYMGGSVGLESEIREGISSGSFAC